MHNYVGQDNKQGNGEGGGGGGKSGGSILCEIFKGIGESTSSCHGE